MLSSSWRCPTGSTGLQVDSNHSSQLPYLRESPFKPQHVYRKGEAASKNQPEGDPLTESGFVLVVGEDDYPQLIERVVQALDYWDEELHALNDAGADKMLLDFGVDEQTMLQRPQYLPPELITAMSHLEMALVVSVVRNKPS